MHRKEYPSPYPRLKRQGGKEMTTLFLFHEGGNAAGETVNRRNRGQSVL